MGDKMGDLKFLRRNRGFQSIQDGGNHEIIHIVILSVGNIINTKYFIMLHIKSCISQISTLLLAFLLSFYSIHCRCMITQGFTVVFVLTTIFITFVRISSCGNSLQCQNSCLFGEMLF